jgi:hypothetical protein
VIYYVTGILGSGKSYYGVRKLARGLLEGKAVVSNIRLADGWEERVLKHSHFYKMARKDRKNYMVREIQSRYLYEPDLPKLISTRIKGKGEGRGVMVIDEAHNELNHREWQEANQKIFLRKLSLSRKRGWQVYLLSQHKDNTDASARRVAQMEIRLVNWKQWMRVPILNTPLLPLPLFLALGYALNQSTNVMSSTKVRSREFYPIGWYRRLYDTFEDFDTGDELDASGVVLPFPVAPKPVPAKQVGWLRSDGTGDSN